MRVKFIYEEISMKYLMVSVSSIGLLLGAGYLLSDAGVNSAERIAASLTFLSGVILGRWLFR